MTVTRLTLTVRLFLSKANFEPQGHFEAQLHVLMWFMLATYGQQSNYECLFTFRHVFVRMLSSNNRHPAHDWAAGIKLALYWFILSQLASGLHVWCPSHLMQQLASVLFIPIKHPQLDSCTEGTLIPAVDCLVRTTVDSHSNSVTYGS